MIKDGGWSEGLSRRIMLWTELCFYKIHVLKPYPPPHMTVLETGPLRR